MHRTASFCKYLWLQQLAFIVVDRARPCKQSVPTNFPTAKCLKYLNKVIDFRQYLCQKTTFQIQKQKRIF